MTKVQVIAGRNYRTQIHVNNVFVYQTSFHPSIEISNLRKLFRELKLEDIEVTDNLSWNEEKS